MTDLKLIEVTPEYAGQLWQFRKEVFEHDPDDGNRFAGCMSIESASSAEKWIKMCQLRKSTTACKQAGVDVPSTTYFAVRKSDNKLVGVIDLRHHINHPILGTWGGHCGYTVRPFRARTRLCQGNAAAESSKCQSAWNQKSPCHLLPLKQGERKGDSCKRRCI